MSNTISDRDRANREAQSVYQDGFKHISTLIVATSLLTAALFRDSLANVPAVVFVGFGISLALSLCGLYFTTTDYPKNIGISSFVNTIFKVTLLVFFIGLIGLAASPLFLAVEGSNSFLIIVVATVILIAFTGIGIYLIRRLDRAVTGQRRGIRKVFEDLEKSGVNVDKMKQDARNEGIDIDEIWS